MLVSFHLNVEAGRDTAGKPLAEFGSGSMGELGIDTPGMIGLGNAWEIESWATGTLGYVLC